MTNTLRHGRAAAIIETLQRTEWQASNLEDAIWAARVREDHAEIARLEAIANSCKESASQYRAELNCLTAQQRLNLEG